MLLTRPPLSYPRRNNSARLACIRHAASVRPEPGSNSPIKCLTCSFWNWLACENRSSRYTFNHSLFSFQRSMSSSLSPLFSASTFIIYHVWFHNARYFFKFFSRSSFLLRPVCYSRSGRNKNIPCILRLKQEVKYYTWILSISIAIYWINRANFT